VYDFFYYVENLIQQGPLISIPLVFISGIVVSLTPCFYPLIPVVLGVVGIRENTSRKKGFFTGLVFVLGLGFIYTILGIISALSGSLFGQVAKNSFVQVGVGVVFFFLGFSLLDIWHMPCLSFFRISKERKPGFFKVFIVGAVSGLVMGSCTLPVLGAILVLIAFYRNVVMGALLLFVFSLGIGVLFVLVAVFGSNILTFLKSRVKVFLGVKKSLGALILGLGLYFFIRGMYFL
jgi:cytochrome c biogenesis protein CcdA